MFNVKPIIIADAKGQNAAIEKIMGKAKAFARVADRVVERAEISNERNTVLISHSDCIQDAETIKEMLKERFDATGLNVDFHIGYVDSAIGASVGPGTIMVSFYGAPVDYNV